MSEGMTATWIELEERDAKAITDRLQRDATNGDMAHNALADALIWNIEHNIASSKMIFAVPDTIIKKLKAENMCADGITIPLPGGKAVPLVIDGETVDKPDVQITLAEWKQVLTSMDIDANEFASNLQRSLLKAAKHKLK